MCRENRHAGGNAVLPQRRHPADGFAESVQLSPDIEVKRFPRSRFLKLRFSQSRSDVVRGLGCKPLTLPTSKDHQWQLIGAFLSPEGAILPLPGAPAPGFAQNLLPHEPTVAAKPQWSARVGIFLQPDYRGFHPRQRLCRHSVPVRDAGQPITQMWVKTPVSTLVFTHI